MMTSIFVLCCRIIVSENEEEKLFHGEFLLTVQCITSLMLVLVFVKVQHPCVSIRPIIRVVCICSSLAVCLISCYVNLVKLTSREFECVFVLCMVCAVLLTLYLNVFLDSSSGSVCTYIAFDEYKNATRCTLKNGYDFSYRGCPTPIGCSGRIRQFDGWFNLSYLIPIG